MPPTQQGAQVVGKGAEGRRRCKHDGGDDDVGHNAANDQCDLLHGPHAAGQGRLGGHARQVLGSKGWGEEEICLVVVR